MLKNLEYNNKILFKNDTVYKDLQQIIILSKYHCDTDIKDRYYLRAHIINNNKLITQGFLYFYINFLNKESNFIGVGVNDTYRNQGIASLLISSWVQLCLDENIYNLSTITKQRKPFILYLLKKYEFELANKEDYKTSNKVVYICKKDESLEKFILFKRKKEKEIFSNSKVKREDNYQIIDKLEKEISIIDEVCLSTPYYLQDQDKAYQKSLSYYNKFKR